MGYLKPLNEITGHDLSDCRSWERDGGLSDKELEELAGRYANWLRYNSRLPKDGVSSLCFLDLTLTTSNENNFGGVLITCAESSRKKYSDTVRELVRSEAETEPRKYCRTVGSHAVFQAGLPRFKVPTSATENRQDEQVLIQPQNQQQLEEYAQLYGPIAQQDDFLCWVDETTFQCNDIENRVESLNNSEGNLPQWDVIPVTKKSFGHAPDAVEYERTRNEASSFPVEDNWKLWTDSLAVEKENLRNLRGEPLSVVFGIPLVALSSDFDDPCVPVAQIFLGTGGPNAEEHAQLIASEICMHALRSHTGVKFSKRGEMRGTNLTMSTTGHEAAAQLRSVNKFVWQLVSVASNKSFDPEAVAEIIEGSLSYAQLFLSGRPAGNLEWSPTKTSTVADWLKICVDAAWSIVVARETQGLYGKEVLKATPLISIVPEVQKEVAPNLRYVSTDEVQLPYDLLKWMLAALSNALKWSAPGTGEKTGLNLLKGWKEVGDFRPIKVIVWSKDHESFIGIYNGCANCSPTEETLKKKPIGTGKVLRIISEEFPAAKVEFGSMNAQEVTDILPGETSGWKSTLWVGRQLFE